MFDNAANLRKTGDIMPIFQEKNVCATGVNPWCTHFYTIITVALPVVQASSPFSISSILMADNGMRVPGPKMAATPAL